MQELITKVKAVQGVIDVIQLEKIKERLEDLEKLTERIE